MDYYVTTDFGGAMFDENAIYAGTLEEAVEIAEKLQKKTDETVRVESVRCYWTYDGDSVEEWEEVDW